MGGAEAVAGGAFGWGGAPGATAGGGEEAEEAGVDLERGLHCAGAAFGAGGDAEAGGGNGLADEEVNPLEHETFEAMRDFLESREVEVFDR